MTREQKLGTVVLIVLALFTVGTLWFLVSVLNDVDWSAGDYGWPDIVIALSFFAGVCTYLYDVVKRRDRYKRVTVKAGLRSVEIVGYKDSHFIAATIMERLTERNVT